VLYREDMHVVECLDVGTVSQSPRHTPPLKLHCQTPRKPPYRQEKQYSRSKNI